MKKILLLAAVLIFLAGITSPVYASSVKDSLDVTGVEWISTPKNEKLAYLLGASSIVAVNLEVAKKSGVVPDQFTQGWMEAFGHLNFTDIMKLIDNWYANNPNQKDRHVLDVIYYEFIAPGQK